jgi:hypothetical protein
MRLGVTAGVLASKSVHSNISWRRYDRVEYDQKNGSACDDTVVQNRDAYRKKKIRSQSRGRN